MSKVITLILALSFSGPAQAMKFPDLWACWRWFSNAAEKEKAREELQIAALAQQVEATQSECGQAEWANFAAQFQLAEMLEDGVRKSGISYAILFQDGDRQTVRSNLPTVNRYESWEHGGDINLLSAIRRGLDKMGEGGVDPATLSYIEIRVARTAGREEEAKTKEMFARLMRRVQALGLRVKIRLQVAQMTGHVPAALGEWSARLTPLYLTPESRYETVSTSLADEKIPADSLQTDDEGRLLRPFNLPEGVRASSSTTPPIGGVPISGLTIIPTELQGKPVYAIRGDGGVTFGFEWKRTVVTITSYVIP